MSPSVDAIRSVRQLIDADENIVEHREYDSFGQITALYGDTGALKESGGAPDLDAIDSVFAFAGREWDNDAGLYYNRARWFDPRIGRFLSEDPIGFEGGDTNLYRYAANNPLSFSDPTGHSILSKILKKVEKGFKQTIRSIEGIITHPDQFAKGLASNPLALGSLFVSAFLPSLLPSLSVTWGAFQYGAGLGGFGFNTNWLQLGTDTFSFLSGQGFNLGLPTFNLSTPFASAQWSPLASPVQYAFAGQMNAATTTQQRHYDPNVSPTTYQEAWASSGPSLFEMTPVDAMFNPSYQDDISFGFSPLISGQQNDVTFGLESQINHLGFGPSANWDQGFGQLHQQWTDLTLLVDSNGDSAFSKNLGTDIFHRLERFSDFNQNTAATVKVQKNYAYFDAYGFLGWGSDKLNDVWQTVTLDSYPNQYLLSADTAAAHALVGQRHWMVDVNPLTPGGLNIVSIRTEAFERVRNSGNYIGWSMPYFGGEGAQHQIWESYFGNVRSHLTSTYDVLGVPLKGGNNYYVTSGAAYFGYTANPWGPPNQYIPAEPPDPMEMGVGQW